MNTMKKILAVLLTLLIAVTMTAALTGCGDDDEDSSKKKSKKTKKSETSASEFVSPDDEEDWDDVSIDWDEDDWDDVSIDWDEDYDSSFSEFDVEMAASAYMSAMLYGDAEELLDCALPGDSRLWAAVEAEGSSRQELLDTFESILSVIQELSDEGADFDYDVSDVMEKDVSSLGAFKSSFDTAGMPITQAAVATITFKVSYEGESDSQEMEVTCYQCDGEWYCIGDLSDF